MIARVWRGETEAATRQAYLEALDRTGLRGFATTPGNRGHLVLNRERGERDEVLMLSFWDSMEAIRRFAGPEAERARFYPEDDEFLISRELAVSHYDVSRHAWRARP